jgi:ABC-type lipopolysaccharide export system ATPase subunit
LSEGSVIAAGNREDVLADEKVRKVYLGEDFRL